MGRKKGAPIMSTVVPVSKSTLKKVTRGKSPKDAKVVSPNITDQATATKKSSKSEKTKKTPTEKTPKISKTLTARPITDLGKVKFVPRWVTQNIPERLTPPSDQRFSFLALYLKVRDLAAADGKVYYQLSVGELIDLLMKYSEAHPDTAIGQRMLNLKPLQVRDLRARLQWTICPTLKTWDAQVKERQDSQEKKVEK